MKYLNTHINNDKLKNCLELNSKTEPNIDNNNNDKTKIIIGLENFLSTNPSEQKKSNNNNIIKYNKTTKNFVKSNKNSDVKDMPPTQLGH